MSSTAIQQENTAERRIEELGRIILAYSEVTEKLQVSHDRLEQTVRALRNELSEKNRQLERRKRLAALGEMAAGMAHEIRNPLGAIQLYASLLAQDLADRPASQSQAAKIGAGVRRLETVVSQVLAFTREVRLQAVTIDLSQIIAESLELAHPALGPGISASIEGTQPMEVVADGGLLGQAILNLLRNAGEAMDGQGELRIAYGRPGEGWEARQFYLVVEDNGPGIEPAVMERIFDPFFTTRDHGTGLGLAIVHRIVEAHDGSITASNRQPCGARFEIRI